MFHKASFIDEDYLSEIEFWYGDGSNALCINTGDKLKPTQTTLELYEVESLIQFLNRAKRRIMQNNLESECEQEITEIDNE